MRASVFYFELPTSDSLIECSNSSPLARTAMLSRIRRSFANGLRLFESFALIIYQVVMTRSASTGVLIAGTPLCQSQLLRPRHLRRYRGLLSERWPPLRRVGKKLGSHSLSGGRSSIRTAGRVAVVVKAARSLEIGRFDKL